MIDISIPPNKLNFINSLCFINSNVSFTLFHLLLINAKIQRHLKMCSIFFSRRTVKWFCLCGSGKVGRQMKNKLSLFSAFALMSYMLKHC